MVEDWDDTFESLKSRIAAAQKRVMSKRTNSHTEILTNLIKAPEEVKNKEE
tara:strand:+ start:349 stop:501 length:153 start_codon:yes stop_codon:yes gene_type:complete